MPASTRRPPCPPAPFSRHDFFSLPLDDPGQDGLIDWLTLPDPASVAPRVTGYLNAHTTNLALRPDSVLAPLLRRFDMVYPDGMAVVRAARRRGIAISGRVSAADFFWRFCWAAAARGRTLALVGGPEGLAVRCAEHLQRRVPALQIVHSQHGFIADPAERTALEQALRETRPAITLLGMGSPQQEALALELRDGAGLPTVWCVGALLEYYTPGTRRHAPLWMRQAGLEWAFRLSQEPRRLARRYLLGNAEFLWRTRGRG